MSANPEYLIQILQLGVTDDIELIKKSLLATKNQSVDAAVMWIFSNQSAAPEPDPVDNILNQPDPEPKAPERSQQDDVEKRKVELEKKAQQRLLKKEEEEKEREFKLSQMQEQYEAYQAEKARKAEEFKARVAMQKQKAEQLKQKQGKSKVQEQLKWHAKQEKYYKKEADLQKMILDSKAKKEVDIKTVPQAVLKIMSKNVRHAEQTFSLLIKVLEKIMKNPKEEKFRTLKRTAKKIETLVVDPLGGEKLLLILGFERTVEDLTLGEKFHERNMQWAVKYMKAVVEFTQSVQKTITKQDLMGWYVAVNLLLDHYTNNTKLPDYELCQSMQKVMKAHMDSEDKKKMGIYILQFHESMLWRRHPFRKFFAELKLRVVDEKYMKRAIRILSTILKNGESSNKGINLAKLEKKVPHMQQYLWQNFFEMCGYAVGEGSSEVMAPKKDFPTFLYGHYSATLIAKSADLIDVK